MRVVGSLSAALVVLAAAAIVPNQAEATPIAIWGGFVTLTGPDGAFSETISTFGNQSVSSADGSASVQSNATPLPGMTATATANSSANGSEAFGSLNYWFEVFGPASTDPTASVNIFANGSLFSDSGTMQSTDFLRVNGTTIVNATSSGGNNNGTFIASTTLSGLSYNTDYFIEMNVTAIAHPSGTATAFLDPYLSLDPSLVAQGYSIITSEGIGNTLTVNSVPGPVVGAGLPGLIIASAGMLGWWRRRRTAPTAA